MVFDLIKSLFGLGNSDSYNSLKNWLSTKITPGDEKSVRAQLESIKKDLPEIKRKGFEAFIKSKAWKKLFCKN
ncbi:MAG: hypothetical protein QXD43_05780 [Candidatus Aenigmatarchaeota archaeon]